jgi:hypothetical protein
MDQRLEIINEINSVRAQSEAERKQLRFTFNLEKLARGEVDILRSGEFVESLQKTLQVGATEYREEELNIVKDLCQGLTAKDPTIRERSMALLSPVADSCLAATSKAAMFTLIPALCGWLEYETELLPGYEIMVKRIEGVTQHLLDSHCWREVEPLMGVLSSIATGGLKKNSAMRSLAGQLLSTHCKKAVLTRLTDDYLIEGEDQHAISNILLAFGTKAALYLLGRVIISQSKEERIALIHQIPFFGDQVVHVLSECLENKPPWYVVRNVIYIIGEIGRDENYALVEPYLSHSDERVQYEVVCCVIKIGGSRMVSRLTDGLRAVNDRLKVHVIRLLEQYSTKNEDFFTALCNLAEAQKNFSVRSDQDLVRALTAAFKTFPCRHTTEVLKKLQAKCCEVANTEQLSLLIDEAIFFIEPMIRHSLQKEGNWRGDVSYDSDPAKEQQAFSKMRKMETKLAGLIGSGDMGRVGGLIRQQVKSALEERDFTFAEMLRDRLMEIDPMAFSQAIELGELIDDKRSEIHGDHHLEIWSDLYEGMSTEEFNMLYSSLREERYQKGESIVNSGETDNKLFFINSGYVSLGCMVGGKEIFLKRMQPGNILGSDQFFSASVWTVNLKALSPVQVQVLDLEALEEIAADYPNIEEKLRDYCRKFADISELLEMSGDDRREFPRFSGFLKIRTTLVDPYGSKGRRALKGDLVDISKSGLAFTIRISSKNSARLLLGRQVVTDLILDGEVVTCAGIIVGVRQQVSNELTYSVHVKLSKHIEKKRLSRIVSHLT